MNELGQTLEREIVIGAPRPVVFRYFTDSERFAAWWGAGSTIEGRVGGAVAIRYPNDVTASGQVLEIEPGRRIVFSFGYDSGRPIPPGSSRVTIELHDDPAGTRLCLRHDFAGAAERDMHVAGWRYQLALFANVAADEAQAGLDGQVDRWFQAWGEQDAARRRELLADCVAPAVIFRDAFACVSGLDDLEAHIAAAQFHMPGIVLRRQSAPRHCQGTALVDWTAEGPDGRPAAYGINVFVMTADGRIGGVVGIRGGSA